MLARIHTGSVHVVAAYDQSHAFRSSQLALEFRALLNERQHREFEVAFVHGSFDRSAVGGFNYSVSCSCSPNGARANWREDQ